MRKKTEEQTGTASVEYDGRAMDRSLHNGELNTEETKELAENKPDLNGDLQTDMMLGGNESENPQINAEDDTYKDADVKEKKQHRIRIRKIKRILVVFLLLLLLLPSLFCLFNLGQILHLQQQITSLNQKIEAVSAEYEQKIEELEQIKAEADRIAVSDNQIWIQEDAVKRKVCLSFDDGPSSNTEEILKILAENDVKATFFVTGKNGYEKEYKDIVKGGHTLGMHSYGHKYDVVYKDLKSFVEDFHHIQNFLKEITGVECHYYRFPGGSSNTVSSVDMRQCIAYLEEQEISYIDWNISSEDAAGAKDAEEIVENVMGQIAASKAETMVVLMHDSANKTATVEALPEIIRRLKEIDDIELTAIDENVNPVHHVSLQPEEREAVFEEMHTALQEE